MEKNNDAASNDNKQDRQSQEKSENTRTKKKKKSFSIKPYKIADKVKRFSMDTGVNGTMLVFLKKDNNAYGWGSGKGYVFTSKYKKSWNNNPVKLKSKIKHIYAGNSMTLLLDRKNRLYWAGIQIYKDGFEWLDEIR